MVVSRAKRLRREEEDVVQVEEDNKVGSRRDRTRPVHCLSVYSRNTRLKSVVVLLDCFLTSAYTPVHNMQSRTSFLGLQSSELRN